MYLSSLEIIALSATVAMTAVCLFVQTAVYPLFGFVDQESFVRFERVYTGRAGIVIVPLMLTELGTAIALATVGAAGSFHRLLPAWLPLFLLAIVWGCTFMLNVPQHHRLERGYDATVHRDLLRTGWIRTSAWCLRSGLMIGAIW